MKRYPPKLHYSECFLSIQGEGYETGRPFVFLRTVGCNFRCQGFTSDGSVPKGTEARARVKDYERLEDVPVIEQGCDSAYAFDPAFKQFWKHGTATEVADVIEACLTTSKNESGAFKHPYSGEEFTLCFTGGEPLLQQDGLLAVLCELERRGNLPNRISFETNGTRPLKEPLVCQLRNYIARDMNVFFAVSPKLSISGEQAEHAIRPDVVQAYHALGASGQLKFVVDLNDQTWQEVRSATKRFKAEGIDWPVIVMPVGATTQQQEAIQKDVAKRALLEGYGFSGRLHCWVFGNEVGT